MVNAIFSTWAFSFGATGPALAKQANWILALLARSTATEASVTWPEGT